MAAMTATQLVARAMGLPDGGPSRCCFCGAPAMPGYRLPDSYTAIDRLAAPYSGAICAGCRFATTATAGQSPEGKPWMWSWVVAGGDARRHALCVMLGGDRVRAGRDALRVACLRPPEPPYLIALCVAGRTHTLFRSATHQGGPGATLNLDGSPLRYDPVALADRVALCEAVARALGGKTARDRLPVPAGRWTADNVDLIEQWHDVLAEPLTAAAAALFPAPPRGEAEGKKGGS